MNRRTVLTTTGVALGSLITGCTFRNESPETGANTTEAEEQTTTNSDNGAESTESEKTSTDEQRTEFERSREILIIIKNVSAKDRQGSLMLSGDTGTISEQEFEIEGGEQQSRDSEIADTGQYELRVTTKTGAKSTFPFDIDAYDLREGSDLLVEIGREEITIVMQE